MGVVTVKSAIITKAEANKLQAPLWLAGAAIHAAVAAVEVAATDSNNSIYRFCRVWSGWRLHRIDLFNDALTSGTDFNFGLWHVNDGAAADDNLFADAVTMATARTQPTDLLFYTLGIEKAEKRVWELLGLTEDPMIEYDLGCIAIAKGSGAGTLTLRVEWAQAVQAEPVTPLDIWQRLGGIGLPPACLGRHRGPLLILGGARCVWSDLDRVSPWGGEVMAVNDVGAHYQERLAHWATLHPEYLPGWLEYRLGHCYGEGAAPRCHARTAQDGVNVVWPLGTYGDYSGLFAAYVGLLLGYAPIVLAGIPATNDGHYFDPPWVTASGFDARLAFSQWSWANTTIFAGRVRSLSGNTRDWLGEPN